MTSENIVKVSVNFNTAENRPYPSILAAFATMIGVEPQSAVFLLEFM